MSIQTNYIYPKYPHMLQQADSKRNIQNDKTTIKDEIRKANQEQRIQLSKDDIDELVDSVYTTLQSMDQLKHSVSSTDFSLARDLFLASEQYRLDLQDPVENFDSWKEVCVKILYKKGRESTKPEEKLNYLQLANKISYEYGHKLINILDPQSELTFHAPLPSKPWPLGQALHYFHIIANWEDYPQRTEKFIQFSKLNPLEATLYIHRFDLDSYNTLEILESALSQEEILKAFENVAYKFIETNDENFSNSFTQTKWLEAVEEGLNSTEEAEKLEFRKAIEEVKPKSTDEMLRQYSILLKDEVSETRAVRLCKNLFVSMNSLPDANKAALMSKLEVQCPSIHKILLKIESIPL